MLLVSTRSLQKDPLAHSELVTPVNAPDVEQVRDTTPKLQDVVAAARPNLSDTESRELDELLNELLPSDTRGFASPGIGQDAHHTAATGIIRHGRALNQNV
jgi:hypothetical protein